MDHTCVKPRIFLGKFDLKIHQEKIAKSKETFSSSTKEEIEMCGKYLKDSIVEDVEIKFSDSQPQKFHFVLRTLSERDREIMNEVPYMMSRPKVPMYSANPYDCEINQMKLYHDTWNNQVLRCVIEDLYCIQTNEDSLELNVNILSIDTGQQYRHVPYDLIYDIPHRINYLLDVDDEAKLAKLNLPKGLDEEEEIFDRFKTFIRTSGDTSWKVKICGYDDDNIYRIDLVTKKQDTFLERFSKVSDLLQAREKITRRDNKPSHQLQQVMRLIPVPCTRRTLKSNQKAILEQTYKRYHDAIDFFTSQLYVQSHKQDVVHNKRRLLKVAVLDWYGPDQVTIVPLDRDYSCSHKEFLNSLASLKSMQNLDKIEEIRLYEPGQFVIFRNVFEDNELGPWLRGVIMSMSSYNEHNLLIGQRRTMQERKKNFQTIRRLVKDGKVQADDLIYRVRSVDYGCDCRASPINMRYVKNPKDFVRVGTWALTCRLFGVHLFDGEHRFSRDTSQAFDSWLRGKMAGSGHENSFYVIIRDDLFEYEPMRDFDKTYNISLFHRKEMTNGLCVNLSYPRPNQCQFECINWNLVEKGHATQYFEGGSSNVQLEDHVMKVLTKYGKL